MISPYRSWIACTILLVLGSIALMRIEFATTEGAEGEELIVVLSLERAGNIDEITRTSVTRIEAAVRTVCTPRRISGIVHDRGAWLKVMLPEGSDSTAKAARLLSELESLRLQLPRSSRLDVYEWGEGSTGELMLILLRGGTAPHIARSVRDGFLSIPGVRDARLIGIDNPAITVRLHPGSSPDSGRAIEKLIRSSDPEILGTVETLGRRVELFGPSDARPVERRSVVLEGQRVPLEDVAEVRYGENASRFRLRLDGEDTAGIALYRESNANIFELEEQIRSRIRKIEMELGIDLEVIRSEAEEMTLLLRRWGWGLLAASVLLALVGIVSPGRPATTSRGRTSLMSSALSIALIPWVVASGAILAMFMTGRSIDPSRFVITIIASTLAIIPGLMIREEPLAARLRLIVLWIAVTGAIPLIIEIISAVALLEITADSVAIVTAAAGAGAAALALPAGPPLQLPLRVVRVYRKMLSQPATLLLAVTSVLFVSYTFFGDALDPHNEAPVLRTDSLLAKIDFPEGGTIDRARAMVEQAENVVREIDGVERVLTRYDASTAELHLELDPDKRDRHAWSRISLDAQYHLAARGFGVAIRPPQSESGDLTRSREKLEPAADADAISYRVILRSSSASGLRTAIARVRDRAPVVGLSAEDVRVEGEAIRPHLELVPRLDAPLQARREIGRIVNESGGEIDTVPLMDDAGSEVVIRPHWSDWDGRNIPQISELLGRPTRSDDDAVVPDAWAYVGEKFTPVSIPREDGQFVQIVNVAFPWNSWAQRIKARERFDAILRDLPLPGEVDLEQPVIEGGRFNERRMRMIGLLVLTPLLFWTCASIVLNQMLFEPLAAIVPAIAGTAAGAALLRLASIQISAVAILVLLSVAAASVFVSTVLLSRGLGAGGRGLSVARGYRSVRSLLAIITCGAVALISVSMAFIFGGDSARFAWVDFFTLAAVSGGTATIMTALVPASALLLLVELRRLPAVVEARRKKAGRWHDERTHAILSVQSITKIYSNGHQALSSVSFDLEPSIVALLGPNGAGKSTLIRIMTGLLQPTRGEIRFKGDLVTPGDLAAYRRLIGYLPQEFNAYPEFSAEQFLDYWAIEIGMTDRKERREQIEEILIAVGLGDHAGRKVRDFSGGMRQRIGIARALLGAPPVLIVDEPTTGLDIESRQRLRAILRTIAVHRIVILSTHIASDVEGTASRVLLLNRGVLHFDGTPADLARNAHGRTFETVTSDEDLHRLTREYRVTARVRTIDGVRIRGVARHDQPLPGSQVPPNLEEGYLAIIDETSGPRGDRGHHYDFIRTLFEA